MVFSNQGKLLHERGTNNHLPKSRVNALWIVDRCINGRSGEYLVKCHHHALRATHLIEIVVNQRYFHNINKLLDGIRLLEGCGKGFGSRGAKTNFRYSRDP